MLYVGGSTTPMNHYPWYVQTEDLNVFNGTIQES